MNRSTYYIFFCQVIIISILYFTIYFVAQQIIRQSANNPQIQMSEDLAYSLSNGQNYDSLLFNNKINPELSLSPFTIIYDIKGKVLSSDVDSSIQLSALPSDVFNYAQENTEDSFTWQPKSNLRIAAVVTEYIGKKGGGFVLVGRSLKTVENLESFIEEVICAAWVGSLLLVFIFTRFCFSSKKN